MSNQMINFTMSHDPLHYNQKKKRKYKVGFFFFCITQLKFNEIHKSISLFTSDLGQYNY